MKCVCFAGPGTAGKGASLFPAVLQWRNDCSCWKERRGGRKYTE